MGPFNNLKNIALLCFSGGAAVAVARADITISGVPSEGKSKLCVQDAVLVEWKLNNLGVETELVWIDVQQRLNFNPAGSSGTAPSQHRVARFDVFQYGYDYEDGENDKYNGVLGEAAPSLEQVHPVPKSLERLHSLIQSRHDGPFKTPDIQTV